MVTLKRTRVVRNARRDLSCLGLELVMDHKDGKVGAVGVALRLGQLQQLALNILLQLSDSIAKIEEFS